MVASMEKHRALIGTFGSRMCSKNWKMGFKKRGAHGVRSDSGYWLILIALSSGSPVWISFSTHPRVISGIALNSRGLGGISRTGSISNSYMDSSSILPDQSMSMTMPVSRLRVAKLATTPCRAATTSL